jgi:hypothetical protein
MLQQPGVVPDGQFLVLVSSVVPDVQSLCLCERRSFASDAAIWSLTNVITYNAAIDARADRRAEIWLHWMEEAAVAEPQLALTPSPTVLSRTCAPRRVRLIVQSSGSSSWSEHEVARFGRARRMAMLAPAALFVETGVGLELLCWDTPTAKRFTVQATGKTTQPSMWVCVEVLN